MALIDRIFRDNPDPSYDGYISNHAFSAAVWYWAKGDITRQNVIDAFGLLTEDEVQLDELQAHYQGLSTQDKRAFHSDLEAAGVLAEDGLITRAQYRALLSLS